MLARRVFPRVVGRPVFRACSSQVTGTWKRALVVPVLSVPLAGFAYYCSLPEKVDVTLKKINDDVFDTRDNLFVFFFDQSEDVHARSGRVKEIVTALAGHDSLSHLTYYYNVREEGDPPVPDPALPVAEAGPPLRVVMYKGQRKKILLVGDEVPLDKIKEFYAPLVEELTEANRTFVVPLVSGKTFHEDVVKASDSQHMVLLQMFEDTCFLCFLMRPFVNTLAALLKEHCAPITIKRLNVEKNDFPRGCPVARGTPTFVLFRGERAVKWEEFKPHELADRIRKEYPSLSEEFYEKMDEYQGLVSRRFQLFTQAVMWNIEVNKLEKLQGATGSSADDEDASFNSTVSQMMAQDMKRLDGIVENLETLQREVDEVELDALTFGKMLAESTLLRERAEEEAWRGGRLCS